MVKYTCSPVLEGKVYTAVGLVMVAVAVASAVVGGHDALGADLDLLAHAPGLDADNLAVLDGHHRKAVAMAEVARALAVESARTEGRDSDLHAVFLSIRRLPGASSC